MQIEKYTDRLCALVQSVQNLALRSGHQQITPLHLLLLSGALKDGDTVAVTVRHGQLAINGNKLAQAA